MLLRLERRRPHPRKQLRKTRVAGEIAPQHHCINEAADQPLKFHQRPVSNGCSDANVLLSAVAGEQQLKGRKKDHEQSCAVAPGESMKLLGQSMWNRDAEAISAIALHLGARPVGRELQQCWHVRKPGTPVGKLPIELFPCQILALP